MCHLYMLRHTFTGPMVLTIAAVNVLWLWLFKERHFLCVLVL